MHIRVNYVYVPKDSACNNYLNICRIKNLIIINTNIEICFEHYASTLGAGIQPYIEHTPNRRSPSNNIIKSIDGNL